jgi:hypothetical protein
MARLSRSGGGSAADSRADDARPASGVNSVPGADDPQQPDSAISAASTRSEPQNPRPRAPQTPPPGAKAGVHIGGYPRVSQEEE